MQRKQLLSRLAVAAVLSAPAAARQATPGTAEDPNELFYRAFYEESARRDFTAAKRLYGEYLERAGADAPPELVARATAGRARASQALGEVDEALALWRAVLELTPGDDEARAALERAATLPIEERIAAEIRANVEKLGTTEDSIAVNNLQLYGSSAVPALAAGLQQGRASVAQTCLMLLIGLARQDDAPAIEALAGALRSPGALTLRLIAEQVNALRFSPAKLDIWRAGTELPEPELRIAALTPLWSQVFRQNNQSTLLVQHEDLLLPLLERTARDASFLVRRELVRQAVFGPSVESLPPRTRALLVDLVERGLASEVQGEREMAFQAARFLKEVFRAHVDELLPELLEEEPAVDGGWLGPTLKGGWLEPDEGLTLLASRNLAVRIQVWAWLVKGMNETGGLAPSVLAPHALAAARDWLDTGASSIRSNQGLGLGAAFGAFAFEPAEIAELWRLAYRNGNNERRTLLSNSLRGTETRARAEQVVGAILAELHEPAEREVFLGDLIELDDVPSACDAFRDAAALDGASARSIAYRGLLACAQRGEPLANLDLPFLAEDVAAWNQPASHVLKILAAPAWIEDLDRRVDALEDEHARAFAVGCLAAARGGAAMAATYERLESYGAPSLDVVHSFLRGALIGAPPERGMLDAVAELAPSRPRLLAGLFSDYFEPHSWPFELATRVVVEALRSQELEAYVQKRALELAGARDVDVTLELVLPFLRHADEGVRGAAEGAVARIRQRLELERLTGAFGADARRRALEAVRLNAASEDPTRRRAAALAIAALGEPDGIALLFELLEDADPGVRAAALQAIERLGAGEPPAEDTER